MIELFILTVACPFIVGGALIAYALSTKWG